MATQVLGGKAVVQFGAVEIPSFMLSEISVEVTEATRERSTLAGTFRRPAGTIDTAQAVVTMYLRSVEDLKAIFPGQYNAPTAPQLTGNLIVGSDSCATADGGPLNIHFECDTTDDNDVFFYNAVPMLNFSATYNATDDLTVEVTFMANPDDNGNIFRFGTGNLTAASVWNEVTEATDVVTS